MGLGEARDTIVAVASPPGPGERGVLRVSGPDAARLAQRVLRAAEPPLPGAGERGFSQARFDDGTGEQPCLVLWMGGPRSYTREDVVEFHLPGAEPLLASALRRLVELGARPARRGEFTRRAFESGRIDLSRAEAVAELVAAGTERERRSALALLRGGLSRRLLPLRDALEGTRALVEASLDFDAEDTGHVPTAELLAGLDSAERGLAEALAFEARRQAPTTLPRVVLYGAPNAGKSSLFNALAGEDALVSDEPGTTRDVLRALWRPGEVEVLLVDTAGFETSPPERSEEGARLARAARERAERELAAADLVLWLLDAGARPGAEELRRERSRLPDGVPVVVAWSRIDLPCAGEGPSSVPAELVARCGDPLRLSSRTGAGLRDLAKAVARALEDAGAEAGVARELFARHRDALREAAERVAGARALLVGGTPLDLVAEALRDATRALDEIEGRTSPEDLLDRIFARFCLGK